MPKTDKKQDTSKTTASKQSDSVKAPPQRRAAKPSNPFMKENPPPRMRPSK